MSVRNDILPAADGSRRLSYTRRCGWVDWGHARKGAAERLKRMVEFESASLPMLRNLPITLRGAPAYVLDFGESMGRFHITVSNAAHFVVRRNLSVLDRWSVALSIFMYVSIGFEQLQSTPPFSLFSDSGFSAEDLVSDLIGFYGVYRLLSLPQMRLIAGEVSVTESLRIWDDDLPGGIGNLKNHQFAPILFPTKEGVRSPQDTAWPTQFTGIRPRPAGQDWMPVRNRFINGPLVNARQPIDVSASGEVSPVVPPGRR